MALPSYISKLLERLIWVPIVEFLKTHGRMDSAQHGARVGRSTLSQFLGQQETILSLLENGDNGKVIYLDFSKAFDKVDLGSSWQS